MNMERERERENARALKHVLWIGCSNEKFGFEFREGARGDTGI